MRFVDEVTITVRAGNGGDGSAAMRREAHVPRGGPAGGDGGRGGSIVFEADPGLTTLLDLRYQRLYRAKHGRPGQGKDRHGRGGEDLVIPVPCGTLVFEVGAEGADEALLGDLVEPGQTLVAAKGGRGGRGNLHFVTSTNRAPREAEPGQPGEEKRLRVELRMLAEVGLVGLPNAGKSTLISRISAAKPKIADYPFTTLRPNLGMVRLSDERSFVVADVPGLIEGAHTGAGLGDRFLRHIQRTRVLVYLVDDRHRLHEQPGSAAEDLTLLRGELSAHDPALAERRCVVALNKLDLARSEDETVQTLASLRQAAGGGEVLGISAATGHGIDALLEAIWRELDRAREP